MKALFVILAIAALATAHLEAGEDIEKNGVLFDFGWHPAHPVAGASTVFAFNAVNSTTTVPMDYAEVWIRLEKDGVNRFSGKLQLQNGSASFSYVFPESGEWVLRAQAGGVDAEAKVEIEGKESSSFDWTSALALVAGVAIGFAAKAALK